MNQVLHSRNWVKAVFALAAFAVTSVGFAQDYPSKPIRLLVGFGPGSAVDTTMRIAVDELNRQLPQPIVIENRAGAGGLIAAHVVKNAVPDGYTLMGGSPTTVTPIFIKADPIVISRGDLIPVGAFGIGAYFLYARGDLGVSSLKDLVAKAKANGGKLRFAAPSGVNTVVAAATAKRLGFELEVIPYKTTDQTPVALLNGDCDLALTGTSGFIQHVQSGKINALATFGTARSPVMPSVPTAMEQGIQIEVSPTHGIWAPNGTPRAIIEKLNSAINQSLKNPASVDRLAKVSMVPGGGTPEDQLRRFDVENRIYTEGAALVGLKPE